MMKETLLMQVVLSVLPVLKARKALEGLGLGDKLRVISTDPASPQILNIFVTQRAFPAVDRGKQDSFEFVIVKAGEQKDSKPERALNWLKTVA